MESTSTPQSDSSFSTSDLKFLASINPTKNALLFLY
jgi:hypothetical protein